MIENSNPSYETLIKRLQQIYQQTQSNKESIQNSQPDNSKIYLDNNWLQNIAIVDDTRSDDNTDQPVHPIAYTTIVNDVVSYQDSFIPIVANITSGLMPMTVSYTYQDILPNVTQDIIPFLEYQTTFSVPTGNMFLEAGFLWSIDAWVNEFVVTANGETIWDGIDPPLASNIEVSQYQIDNGYAAYYQQSYSLSFTSSEGGIYGHGETVEFLLLNIFDETVSVYVPLSVDAISNFMVGHSYEFWVWDNSAQESFVIQYVFLTTSEIVINTGAYICLWSDGYGDNTQVPFYIYENFISAGDIVYELFPPAVSEMTNPLNPIEFTINPDGPIKYTDIVGQPLSVYVTPPTSYDPFYIRQSKSTDTKESWQTNVTFGAIATTQGVQKTGLNLPQYDDNYTWGVVGDSYGWTAVYDHTTIEGDQYQPIQYDMTTRVRVAVRPIVNWKKTDKYQV